MWTRKYQDQSGNEDSAQNWRAVWSRRWARRLIITVLLLIVIGQTLPMLFVHSIQSRLEQMVSDRLDAKVIIGRLTYTFPLGLRAHDVELVTDGPDHKKLALLKIRRVDFALAKTPLGNRPIIISKLIFHDPQFHLIKIDGHIVGVKMHGQEPTSQTTTTPTTAPAGDDHLELRRLEIRRGSVVWEDRTRPGGVENVIWKNINCDTDLKEHSPAAWDIHLSAISEPLTKLECDATLQKADWNASIKKLAIEATLDGAHKPVALPTEAQEFVEKNHIGGKLKVEVSGKASLQDLIAGTFSADLSLADGHGQIAAIDAALNHLSFSAHCSNDPRDITGWFGLRGAGMNSNPIYLRVSDLKAAVDDSVLLLSDASVVFDPQSKSWRVERIAGDATISHDYRHFGPVAMKFLQTYQPQGQIQFAAFGSGVISKGSSISAIIGPESDSGWALNVAPHDVQFAPRKFPRPITHIDGGQISITPERMIYRNISAQYEGDAVHLASAELALAHLKAEAQFVNIEGDVSFDGKDKQYPQWLEKPIADTHPKGTFRVSGKTVTDRIPKPPVTGFRLVVSANQAAFELTDHRIPFTNVNGDCVITPSTVVIGKDVKAGLRGCSGKVCGGDFDLAMDLTCPKTTIPEYHGFVNCSSVDVEALAREWKEDQSVPKSARGKLSGSMTFSGRGQSESHTAVDSFRGTGHVDILDGDFFEFPIFKGILGKTNVAAEALKGADASGDFSVENQMLRIESASISAPLVGVQGGGIIKLDGNTDLRVVAAPLGDWKQKLNASKIPLIGEIAGALQRAVNNAQGAILYDFHVTGPITQPQIEPVPVPVLTENAAKLFGEMLKGKKPQPKN